MEASRVIFQILAVLSIITGIIPLVPFLDPTLIPEYIPNQNTICVVVALVFGLLAAIKGAQIGWIGVTLAIVNLIILFVTTILITANEQA